MSERGSRAQPEAPKEAPKATAQAPVEQPMFSQSGGVTELVAMPAHEYKARMQAQVFADAEKVRSQETVPGGAFVVNGQWVDANGIPLKEAPKSSTVDVEAETSSDDDIEAHHAQQPTISNESPEARDVREKAVRERMDRAGALAYLKPRFDKLMLSVELGVADDVAGYAPVLDTAFQQYINLNALSTNITDTTVDPDDVTGFIYLLNAVEYDLLIPFYALQPDISVDAPLTNVKFSQTYRALRELRDEAWAQAAEEGYVGAIINAGGFVLDLAHNEPTLGWSREFG